MPKGYKVLIYLSFLLFLKDFLLQVMQKERYQSQINQNFMTICHAEVCLTFSRLAVKLSEMIAKFWGCSLKIQHWLSFDHNGLKKGHIKHFENSLKSMHFFQILMGVMNFRWRSHKNQMSSAVRGENSERIPFPQCKVLSKYCMYL